MYGVRLPPHDRRRRSAWRLSCNFASDPNAASARGLGLEHTAETGAVRVREALQRTRDKPDADAPI